MLKEILEQPAVVQSTLQDRVDLRLGDARLAALNLADRDIMAITRIVLIACGTSFHAALVAKYAIEALARIPVDVEIASEFRYRNPVLDERVLTIAISQSGETADTLAALRHARRLGSRALAICNVRGSSMARDADGVLQTRAGVEIGVASTKTFTAQLVAVLLLAIRFGRARGTFDGASARRLLRDLLALPEQMETVLGLGPAIRDLAERFAANASFLYFGRGLHYPLALEGALKLKELTYVHAEGYAAGEMKHGPIALISRSTPVVALAPDGPSYEKMAANISEVRARGAAVIAVATEGDEKIRNQSAETVFIPAVSIWMQPFLVAPVLQLLAYHLAVIRGCDVDQPRNLAKSVTVE